MSKFSSDILVIFDLSRFSDINFGEEHSRSAIFMFSSIIVTVIGILRKINAFSPHSWLRISSGISTITGPGRPIFICEIALLNASTDLSGVVICSIYFVILS